MDIELFLTSSITSGDYTLSTLPLVRCIRTFKFSNSCLIDCLIVLIIIIIIFNYSLIIFLSSYINNKLE